MIYLVYQIFLFRNYQGLINPRIILIIIFFSSFSINRQVVPHNSTTFDNPNDSLLNENHHLKERIDEFASNEKNLIELNEDLQRQIQELTHQNNPSSNEAAITNSVHMEQIHSLTKEMQKFKKDYANLEEKYDYEKHELQTIIEQLREDIVDLDKTKQLYIGKREFDFANINSTVYI
jgi:predicted  nucleic acid-binding Zn-ribbon protein